MDRTEELFPNYDGKGKDLIRQAYDIAEKALEGQTRGNGKPFIEHPVNVAKIAADEIGLPAECIAAVFLHEAQRFHPETDIMTGADFGKDSTMATSSGAKKRRAVAKVHLGRSTSTPTS